jgi:hypothetical protein
MVVRGKSFTSARDRQKYFLFRPFPGMDKGIEVPGSSYAVSKGFNRGLGGHKRANHKQQQ